MLSMSLFLGHLQGTNTSKTPNHDTIHESCLLACLGICTQILNSHFDNRYTGSELLLVKTGTEKEGGSTQSVTSIILQSPESQFSFLDCFYKTFNHQAFILVLLGSFSTAEPPTIMQFDFYPWMFYFTFYHPYALIKP